MADIIGDGMVRCDFVPAIANKAAPTTAELNAGTALTEKITPDGLIGFEAETAEVDNSSLASTFDTKDIGRDAYSGTMLRLKRQDPIASDSVYNLLVRGLRGYIAIRRDVTYSTAWASGQLVEIYPIRCGRRKRLAPEANTVSRYEVPTMITDPPEPDAVVA